MALSIDIFSFLLGKYDQDLLRSLKALLNDEEAIQYAQYVSLTILFLYFFCLCSVITFCFIDERVIIWKNLYLSGFNMGENSF